MTGLGETSMTMSSENLVPDVEKGTVVVVRESRPRSDPWKCLGISSFLLLVGATVVLAFLHFRAGQQVREGLGWGARGWKGRPCSFHVVVGSTGRI